MYFGLVVKSYSMKGIIEKKNTKTPNVLQWCLTYIDSESIGYFVGSLIHWKYHSQKRRQAGFGAFQHFREAWQM